MNSSSTLNLGFIQTFWPTRHQNRQDKQTEHSTHGTSSCRNKAMQWSFHAVKMLGRKDLLERQVQIIAVPTEPCKHVSAQARPAESLSNKPLDTLKKRRRCWVRSLSPVSGQGYWYTPTFQWDDLQGLWDPRHKASTPKCWLLLLFLSLRFSWYYMDLWKGLVN